MKRSHTFRKLSTPILLVASAILAVAAGLQTTNQKLDAVTGIPIGPWSLSVGPYTGKGWDAMPVDLVSTTVDAKKGLTAEKFLLRNNSSKNVTSVKLKWFLKVKDEDTVLLQGESPVIGADILDGKDFRLEYPVVTFAKIYKPLLKAGELTGNYLIQVTVSSATYEDGSVWQLTQLLKDGMPTWLNVPQPNCTATTSAGMVKNHVSVTVQGCQDQQCYFCPQCSCYQCLEASGSCCRVNSCTSCTSAKCLKAGCGF